MSEQMQRDAVNDEIHLLEIWQWLARYKWFLLAATMAGAVTEVAVVAWTQPVWEANALIQVGRLGWTADQVVEPIARITTRLEDMSYMRRIEKGLQDSAAIKPIYAEGLQAKPVPGTDFLRITLRAYPKAVAKNLVLAIVNQLKAEHDEMVRPAVEGRKMELAAIERDILDTKNAKKELEKWVTSGNSGKNMFIYMTLRQQIMANEHELGQRKLTLDEQLDKTYPTSLIGDINVSDQPVAPKKGALIFLGAIVGLLAGMFVAFIHNFFRHVSIR